VHKLPTIPYFAFGTPIFSDLKTTKIKERNNNGM
jgi:hypothetical protein